MLNYFSAARICALEKQFIASRLETPDSSEERLWRLVFRGSARRLRAAGGRVLGILHLCPLSEHLVVNTRVHLRHVLGSLGLRWRKWIRRPVVDRRSIAWSSGRGACSDAERKQQPPVVARQQRRWHVPSQARSDGTS